MNSVLSMERVSISFHQKPALQDLTFSVQEGEIFGFLGPSGAGKTTTIKLLTRQLRPDTGEIQVFGQPVASLPGEVYEQIGVLTDNSGVYERLTVWENLELFANLKGEDTKLASQALERVGLQNDHKKLAKNLSKGMRQRMILARAVFNRPKLLFLDEPTAALDPGTTRDIHELLRDLNREGTTIFLTTHNMEEADRLCHTVSFLDYGHIVESGSPEQLHLKYAKEELAAVLESGETVREEKTPQGLRNLAELLEKQGGRLLTLHSQEPDLEEIFLQLTGRKL